MTDNERGLLDWLDGPVSDRGIHASQTDGDWEFISYAELAVTVGYVAHALEQQLPAGATVLLASGTATTFVASFFGCLAAGCTPAPFATPLTFTGTHEYEAHVSHLWAASGAQAALVDPELIGTVRDAWRGSGQAPLVYDAAQLAAAGGSPDGLRRLDGVGLLQFTSGSTGRPKGVRVPSAAIEANVAAITRWGRWHERDAVVPWLPLYHDMGLVGALLTPVVVQHDIWSMSPFEFVRQPARWLACLGEGRATVTAAPTFGYAYAAARVPADTWSEWDFTSWRIAIVGAERVGATALRRFAEVAQPAGFSPKTFAPAYGLAESTLAVTLLPCEREPRALRLAEGGAQIGEAVEIVERAAAVDAEPDRDWLVGCGQPLDGVVLSVVDTDGNPVADGVLGELRVSGTSLADGYQAKPGELERFDRAGHATGDAGFRVDGELYVVGRLGDSLSVKGRNVFAEDLEAALSARVGVTPGRCAVALGASPAEDCCVVLLESSAGVEPAAVLALLRSAIGAGVRIVVITDERGAIPRTSSGKPRRHAIFQAFSTGELPGERVLDERDSGRDRTNTGAV